MIPTTFATGFVLFTGKQRPKIAAVLGLVATLAPALGPTIGGIITESLSWRWLFFINIVPGVLLVLIVPRIVKIDKPDLALARLFDFLGAGLLALFLGSLQYVLDEGPRKGWFDDTLIVGLTLLSLFSAILFVARSLHYRDPVVDLRSLKNRNFTVGCALSFIVGIGLYGSIYLSPVFLGQVRGYNALQIGTIVCIAGISNILATPLTIVLMARMNVKALLLLGFSLFALSCVLFSRVDSSWGPDQIFIPQVLRGVATMFCAIPITGLALGALSGEQLKGGSGIFNLMRNLGGAIGLALINSGLYYDRFKLHYAHLMERVSAGGANTQLRLEAFTQVFDGRLSDSDQAGLAALKLMAKLGRREAFTLGFSDVFLMIAAIFLLALLLIPMIRSSVFRAGAGQDHVVE